jgi:hypothetical protein
VPEEPSIAGVAPAAARKEEGGTGELAARERNFKAVAYCRASPTKARAREEAPKLPRRGICFQRVKLYSLCWRRIQRTG